MPHHLHYSNNLTHRFSPMSPASGFHRAARWIFLHINHIMLLLCSKLSMAFISFRISQSLYQALKCAMWSATPHLPGISMFALPITSPSLIPLPPQWVTLLRTCQVYGHLKDFSFAIPCAQKPFLQVAGYMAWSFSSFRHCSNVIASKVLSWPLR